MRTFVAVSNYDRRWYAGSSIALSATLGLSVLIGIPITLSYSVPAHSVSPLLALSSLICDALIIASPFIFIRYAADLGRSASPLRNRLIIHTLPVDRCEVALAKLFHGFIWVFAVPLACTIMVVSAFALCVSDWSRAAPLFPVFGHPGFWLGVPLFVLASLTWVMLLTALAPGRWLAIGAPLLIIGEAIARDITTGHSLIVYFATLRDQPRSALSVGIDLGLLVLLAFLLSGIFVRYHMRRNRTWCLAAAILVLAGIDGMRALACWYTFLHN